MEKSEVYRLKKSIIDLYSHIGKRFESGMPPIADALYSKVPNYVEIKERARALFDCIVDNDNIELAKIFAQLNKDIILQRFDQCLTVELAPKTPPEIRPMLDIVTGIYMEMSVLVGKCKEYVTTDGNLETLEPLCEYLCTTETGKAVQQWVKAQYYPEQRENQRAGNGEEKQTEAQESPLMLPDELHTDEAVKVFEAAIKAGYITKQGDCYKWNKSNAQLAYMCGRLYCGDSIETSPITKDLEYKKGGYKDFPETAICTLFSVKNLGQSRRQMERPPKGYTGIDSFFKPQPERKQP